MPSYPFLSSVSRRRKFGVQPVGHIPAHLVGAFGHGPVEALNRRGAAARQTARPGGEAVGIGEASRRRSDDQNGKLVYDGLGSQSYMLETSPYGFWYPAENAVMYNANDWNGSYGLVEIKLGGDDLIEKGADTLKELAMKIDFGRMKQPSFLMVLTATGPYAYRREDGIYVVPIGCLKD